MKVTIQLIFKDYLKLQYLLAYRKVRIIIYLILSVLILFLFTTQLINGESFKDTWFGFVILAYMVLLPLLIYTTAKKNFYTYAALQEPITYEFFADKMVQTKENSYVEVAWSKIYKVAEYNNWFLIYQSNRLANLIHKKNLSAEQVAELRFILNSVPNLKKKLKR